MVRTYFTFKTYWFAELYCATGLIGYNRDDQQLARGPLVALGPNLGGPRDLLWKKMTSKKKEKNPDMPRFAPFACHFFKFSGEDPRPPS